MSIIVCWKIVPLIDGLARPDGCGLIYHFKNKNKIKFVLQRYIFLFKIEMLIWYHQGLIFSG
jgi:hypothetical protein